LCEITIIDDVAEPRREGVEKFVVTIISADSRSIVAEPSATVINIDDSDLDGKFTFCRLNILESKFRLYTEY